jgi:hypothetical protein
LRDLSHDILGSLGMGYSVYRRLGFVEYCWIGLQGGARDGRSCDEKRSQER